MRISAYNAEMSMSPRRVDSAPACCLSRSETSVSFVLIVLVIVLMFEIVLRIGALGSSSGSDLIPNE